MTRQNHKLMRQYQDTYHGTPIDIETHIKTSETKESSKKFLRVYSDFIATKMNTQAKKQIQLLLDLAASIWKTILHKRYINQ